MAWTEKVVSDPHIRDWMKYTTVNKLGGASSVTVSDALTSPVTASVRQRWSRTLTTGTRNTYLATLMQNGWAPTKNYTWSLMEVPNLRAEFTQEGEDYSSTGLRRKREYKIQIQPLDYISQWNYPVSSVKTVNASFTNSLNLAEVIALNKLRDHQFNAAVFSAESGKTVSMVLGAASKIAVAMLHVKNGRVVSACRVLGAEPPPYGSSRSLAGLLVRRHRQALPPRPLNSRDAANVWLELQYGWKPLLSDVKNAAEALAERLITRPPVKHVSGEWPFTYTSYHTRGGYTTLYSVQQQPGGTWSTFCNVSLTKAEQCEARRGFVAKRISSQSVSLNNLGLINPLVVAWELLPLSFVADWFVNVGDCLEALSVTQGWEILDHWESRLAVVKSSFALDVRNDMGALNAKTKWIFGNNPTCTYRWFQRTKLSNIPMVALGFRPSFDKSKVVTSASLIRQRSRF